MSLDRAAVRHIATLARIRVSAEQADALVHAGLTRLEDLLSAEEADLSSIPQIGDKAGEVLKAARAHAESRTLPVNS